MITLLRILFGFIIACLVAGVTTVSFVVTPAELANLPPAVQPERLANAGVLALLAATHSAIFSFPFALLVVAVGEIWRVRSLLYYVLAGFIIALGGFLAEFLNEVAGQPSILNNYALAAFAAVGVLSGFAYWLVSGRHAGGKQTVPPAAAPIDPPAAEAGDGEPAPQAS
jgi:hypothetical protein